MKIGNWILLWTLAGMISCSLALFASQEGQHASNMEIIGGTTKLSTGVWYTISILALLVNTVIVVILACASSEE